MRIRLAATGALAVALLAVASGSTAAVAHPGVAWHQGYPTLCHMASDHAGT